MLKAASMALVLALVGIALQAISPSGPAGGLVDDQVVAVAGDVGWD